MIFPDAYPILSRDATKWFIVTEIVFTFSFVALTYGLVNSHGVVGANMAYTVYYLIYFLVVFKAVRRFAK